MNQIEYEKKSFARNLYLIQEMLSFVPNYPNMDEINTLLDDFYVNLRIRDYNETIYMKPYLKKTMNKLQDFYFKSAITDFQKADKLIVLYTDILLVYPIEKWVVKYASISEKDIFYQRYKFH